MTKFFTSIIAIAIPFLSMASTQWTLQGNTYTVDTIAHAKIGPGTTYTAVHASGNYNLNIFYSITDLSCPNVELRAVMANDKIASVATVSNMAKAHNAEGALHFAGVNADFFSGTSPIGTTVANSEIYYASNNGWTHWAFDESRKSHLGSMAIGGTVTNASGSASHALSGVNRYRDVNNLIIFTPKMGATTGSNSYGSEILITPVNGNLALGKSIKMKVSGKASTAGSMAIPAGSYVLSGHGTGKTFVESLTEGEEITVNATLTLNNTSIAATQVLGGQPMILSGGVVLNTETAFDHLTALNPRTAVGHNADGSKVVMLVVDGRNGTVSQGCVSKVLADIMREVGCTEAMNYDGGGSSTFYIDALGVVNRPSENAAQRTVTNGMYAVATSPTDNEIASIAFADYKMNLPRYGYYTPVIYGYNKYGVLVDANLQGYTLSCSSALGEIANGGTSLFANGTGSHALTATYGSATASIPVTIGSSAPSFTLSSVMVDSFSDYTVEVFADVNGTAMPLDNKALTWASGDESIATVDASGKIHGVKNGSTIVYGKVEDFADTISVIFEIPEARYKAIDPNLDAATWTLAKSGVASDSILALTPCGADGLAFDFSLSSARSHYIGAEKTIQFWSIPDSLQIKINPGALTVSQISVKLSTALNSRASWKATDVTLTNSTINTVNLDIRDLIGETSQGAFPVIFSGIRLYMTGETGVAQRIEIPQLSTVYTNVKPDDSGIETIVADNNSPALTLAPNPVSAGQTVSMNIPDDATFAVYAINGTMALQGVGNNFSTERLSKGMYVVMIKTTTHSCAARLIVK